MVCTVLFGKIRDGFLFLDHSARPSPRTKPQPSNLTLTIAPLNHGFWMCDRRNESGYMKLGSIVPHVFSLFHLFSCVLGAACTYGWLILYGSTVMSMSEVQECGRWRIFVRPPVAMRIPIEHCSYSRSITGKTYNCAGFRKHPQYISIIMLCTGELR